MCMCVCIPFKCYQMYTITIYTADKGVKVTIVADHITFGRPR